MCVYWFFRVSEHSVNFNACNMQGHSFCARAHATVLQIDREEDKGLDMGFFKGTEHPYFKITRQCGSSAPLEERILFICQKLPPGSVAQYR